MSTQELRNKSVEELLTEQKSLLTELFSLRMQRGYGEMPRTHQFKQVKRAIARVKTLLKEKAAVNE